MIKIPLSQKPIEFSEKLKELGKVWSSSTYRPRLSVATKSHWDNLIDEWSGSDLPLVVRKSGCIRGSVLKHSSGRSIIIADNSPAHWSFSQAYAEKLHSILDIRSFLKNDSIPFTFATKTAEKKYMAYKCTLSSSDNVNKRGWKLCHIEDVGLNTKIPIDSLPLDILIKHFILLMSPSNHFLIPLEWGGLGEVPEIINEIDIIERMVIDK